MYQKKKSKNERTSGRKKMKRKKGGGSEKLSSASKACVYVVFDVYVWCDGEVEASFELRREGTFLTGALFICGWWQDSGWSDVGRAKRNWRQARISCRIGNESEQHLHIFSGPPRNGINFWLSKNMKFRIYTFFYFCCFEYFLIDAIL